MNHVNSLLFLLKFYNSLHLSYENYDFAETVCSIEYLQSSVLRTVFTLHFCKISLGDAHS